MTAPHDGGGPPGEPAAHETPATAKQPEVREGDPIARRRFARTSGADDTARRREARARALARQLVTEHRGETEAAEPLPNSLRRRADAAYRLPPVREPAPGRSHLARVDPIVPVQPEDPVTVPPCPTCGCRYAGAAS